MATGCFGVLVQQLDPLLDLAERPPAGQPALTDCRRALHRFEVVAADEEREWILLRFWKHLDVVVGVILPSKGRDLLGDQAAEDGETFLHHLAAMGMGRTTAHPGSKFSAF